MTDKNNKGGDGTPVDHVETRRHEKELKEFTELIGSSMERFGEYIKQKEQQKKGGKTDFEARKAEALMHRMMNGDEENKLTPEQSRKYIDDILDGNSSSKDKQR